MARRQGEGVVRGAVMRILPGSMEGLFRVGMGVVWRAGAMIVFVPRADVTGITTG